ncbi:carbohydrate kinase [Drancourtella sp. An177]|nr:carbohydrate kinase [Drancourtella sp. An177]
MNIFCIGQSAYDITVPIEGAIEENRKYRVLEYFECGGGPAFNAACLCGKWGANVELISRIGSDEYGKKLKETLQKYHVGTEYLIPCPGMKTPHSMIIAGKAKGSRTIFNFPGTREKTEYHIPEKKADVILSDGHEPEISLAMIAANPQAISVADAGTFRESTYKVAQKTDYLICSEDFARQYTGKGIHLEEWDICEEIFRQIEQINGRHAVVTLGENGLLYRKKDGSLGHMPACQVKAVDSTGAGDIFHGAFAYGLTRKWNMEKNLIQSTCASGLSVQKIGGLTSIPEFEEVQKKYNKYKKRT